MTQDEIIRMFHEAGKSAGWKPGIGNQLVINYLTHFAALVAAHAKQEYIDSVYEQHRETMFSNKDLGMLVDAVKAEREACAKVCDDMGNTEANMNKTWRNGCSDAAAAIRARGEK